MDGEKIRKDLSQIQTSKPNEAFPCSACSTIWSTILQILKYGIVHAISVAEGNCSQNIKWKYIMVEKRNKTDRWEGKYLSVR